MKKHLLLLAVIITVISWQSKSSITMDEYNTLKKKLEAKQGNLSPELKSLYLDSQNNWDEAHNILQNCHSNACSHIHAYLHRKEGVLWNADYWYRKCGRERPDISLRDEWIALVREYLKK